MTRLELLMMLRSLETLLEAGKHAEALIIIKEVIEEAKATK